MKMVNATEMSYLAPKQVVDIQWTQLVAHFTDRGHHRKAYILAIAILGMGGHDGSTIGIS
jgi:hypothetical protein